MDYREGAPQAYAMVDRVAGKEGRATVSGNELVLELRSGGETKTARQPLPAAWAAGPSIGPLIEQHLSELKAHQEVPFGMAVPARLDVFSLKLVPVEDEVVRLPDGRQLLKIAVKPTSRLGALFAPKMEAFVDPDTGQMLRFRGPLPRPNGEMMRVGTLRYDLAAP
jgi:hypothetical protein